MNFREGIVDTMVDWVREREAIRLKKEQGAPWPWTESVYLQQWRFCNVRRCDDKISRELLERWYLPGADPATLLVAATLGRLVNWTDALLEGTDGSPFTMHYLGRVRRALLARAARGEKVFTGAYIVPGSPGRAKVDFVCDLAESVAPRANDILQPTLRATWEQLVSLHGLGSFLAGQIAADLALLPAGQSWPDAWKWAPVGPGSARGMNRLRGRALNARMSQQDFDAVLPLVAQLLAERVPEVCRARPLRAMDVQSVCCELDKMCRLLRGEGTPRSKYFPPSSQATLL